MSYLIVNAARSAGTIRKTIYGQFSEHLGRCIYGGIADQDGALRPAVLQALKTLHIPVLRWPGGCFADTYHWRDGIGPRSERKTIINTNWGVLILLKIMKLRLLHSLFRRKLPDR